MEAKANLTESELVALRKSGWTVTRLAALVDDEASALKAVLWRLQQQEDEVTLDEDRLAELVKVCAACAQTRHQTDAKRGSQDLMDAHVAHERDLRRAPSTRFSGRSRQKSLAFISNCVK